MSTKLLTISRRILPHIVQDLKTKMVFIGGPRQVGKTTLAQSLLPHYAGETDPRYLTWDNAEHRAIIRKGAWPTDSHLIALDEIHKAPHWRSLIKGFYDIQKQNRRFIVTGSARLDHLRKGGDSLLGRYHYYRLHPYGLDELGYTQKAMRDLLTYGGFPEPLIARDERNLRRWHLSRIEKLIRIDLRDLEYVQDLNKMELLAEELPRRIGSPLSVKNLAGDLEIDPKTCKKWLEHLESLYYCYFVLPYGAPRVKAVKKERKVYLWDWSQITDPAARFENFVASQLLKYCHYEQDVNGHRMELRYLRDVEKREIDFVVLRDRKPVFALECKLQAQPAAESLYYFKERTPIPEIFQVHQEGTPTYSSPKGVTCMPFLEFAKKLSR